MGARCAAGGLYLAVAGGRGAAPEVRVARWERDGSSSRPALGAPGAGACRDGRTGGRGGCRAAAAPSALIFSRASRPCPSFRSCRVRRTGPAPSPGASTLHPPRPSRPRSRAATRCCCSASCRASPSPPREARPPPLAGPRLTHEPRPLRLTRDLQLVLPHQFHCRPIEHRRSHPLSLRPSCLVGNTSKLIIPVTRH